MTISPLARLAALALPCAATADAQPTITFGGEDKVQIGGVAPGSKVALFGVGRYVDVFMPIRLEVWDVVVVDSYGSAIVSLGKFVPAISVWAAVDLATGDLAFAAPAGIEVQELQFPFNALSGTLDTLTDARPGLAVLRVRPSAVPGIDPGGWGGRVQDGSKLDADGVEDLQSWCSLPGLTRYPPTLSTRRRASPPATW